MTELFEAKVNPKYALGSIVETKSGTFGRISCVHGKVKWLKSEPEVYIEYSVQCGGSTGGYEEADIKRIVSKI